MELQRTLPDFARSGVAVFAISYDPVAVLTKFAETHGIQYPLLSDEGSQVIRRLGLFNEHVYEHHAVYGIPKRDMFWGVPYPGAFLLDEAGRILECSSANIAFVRESEVISAGEGVLEGITALVLRRLAPDLGLRWTDERLGASPLLRKSLRYVFPDHWSFLLGEIALYAFVVLVGTEASLATSSRLLPSSFDTVSTFTSFKVLVTLLI